MTELAAGPWGHEAAAAVAAHREGRQAAWLAELRDYLAIPSVSTEGRGIQEACAWVSDRLAALGARVERHDPPGGHPILLAELGPAEGAGAPSLLIYNHYDVQPPDPLEMWTHPPFEPDLRDGKLYARGTADNKGNFLSRVQALEAWRATRGDLPLRILWLVEGEEEIGSKRLPAFCDAQGHRWAGFEGCLWEAGYKNEAERHLLYSGVKGLASFELTARGARADRHSAWATLLPNAAWRLVWALAALKGEDEAIRLPGLAEHVRPPSEADLAALAALDWDDEAVRRTHGVDGFLLGLSGLDAVRRHLFEPTCTLCGIGGGYQGPGMKTVLPAEARAKLDFRLVPDLTPALVGRLLRERLAQAGFGDIEVRAFAGEHPVRGRLDSAVVQAAAAAVRDVAGREAALMPHMAATGPMHPVCGRFGVPSVGFGTGYWGSGPHAPDEHIRMADYWEGVDLMAAFVAHFGELGQSSGEI